MVKALLAIGLQGAATTIWVMDHASYRSALHPDGAQQNARQMCAGVRPVVDLIVCMTMEAIAEYFVPGESIQITNEQDLARHGRHSGTYDDVPRDVQMTSWYPLIA